MTLACFPGSILLGRMISASTVRVQSGVWVISFHEQIVKLVFDALKKNCHCEPVCALVSQ